MPQHQDQGSPRNNPPKPPNALVITRNLPPLVGGMERLVWHIVDALRSEYAVNVIGPAGCAGHLPPDVGVSEVPPRPLWLFLLWTTWRAISQALKRRPRLLVGGSGLAAPFTWLAARLVGGRCLTYLHGLDVEARHPIYRFFWHPFLRRCDMLVVNSRFTRDLTVGIGIDPRRIVLLNPGVDLPDAEDMARQGETFRRRHGLNDAPLMLYVGRITRRKGLAVFVNEVLPRVAAEKPHARLLVIGDEPANALKQNAGEKAGVVKALDANGLTGHLIFLGELAQDDPDLSAAYAAANVLVFPVQAIPGDNEGFGMVAVEAAAHGLPTVAFAAGGVPDAVKDGISGYLVAPEDYPGMAERLIALLSCTFAPDDVVRCSDFASQFSWPLFGDRLRSICRRLLLQTTPGERSNVPESEIARGTASNPTRSPQESLRPDT